MMKSNNPQPVSISLLDVEFRCSHWPVESPKEDREKLRTFLQNLSSTHQGPIKRQGRTRCTYVDVLTDVHCGRPTDFGDNDAFKLATKLACEIPRGTISSGMILTLINYSPINTMQQTFRYHPEKQTASKVITTPGLTIEQIKITPSDRQVKHEEIQRHLIINMDEYASSKTEINWNELAIIAALAHLKCDIEVMIDTGFFPIRMCDRERCHAFYRPSHMAGRSRFCSDTCRACAPREQGKKQEKYSSK